MQVSPAGAKRIPSCFRVPQILRRGLSRISGTTPPPHWQSPSSASPISRTFSYRPRSSFYPFLTTASSLSPRISSLRPPARAFSSTIMVAEKIDGTAIAKRIRERINHEISERQKVSPRFMPSLTIVQGALHVCAQGHVLTLRLQLVIGQTPVSDHLAVSPSGDIPRTSFLMPYVKAPMCV
jgi:methylenetetrahydrofolate dehydrogenase (NADP+)/methenyltetrahydrofolate cyclohydrolase/formyltetrahydrofolate synthetase